MTQRTLIPTSTAMWMGSHLRRTKHLWHCSRRSKPERYGYSTVLVHRNTSSIISIRRAFFQALVALWLRKRPLQMLLKRTYNPLMQTNISSQRPLPMRRSWPWLTDCNIRYMTLRLRTQVVVVWSVSVLESGPTLASWGNTGTVDSRAASRNLNIQGRLFYTKRRISGWKAISNACNRIVPTGVRGGVTFYDIPLANIVKTLPDTLARS